MVLPMSFYSHDERVKTPAYSLLNALGLLNIEVFCLLTFSELKSYSPTATTKFFIKRPNFSYNLHFHQWQQIYTQICNRASFCRKEGGSLLNSFHKNIIILTRNLFLAFSLLPGCSQPFFGL